MKDDNLMESSFNDGSFKNSSLHSKGTGPSIFAFIVLILFAIVFSHYIRTGTFINFSFKSLVDYLSGMPDVSYFFSTIDLSWNVDLGVFNWFRDFVNFFLLDVFELGITLGGMLLQALVIIFYIVRLFFI